MYTILHTYSIYIMCVWAYLLRHVSLYKIQSIDQANQGLLSSYQLLIYSFQFLRLTFMVSKTVVYGIPPNGNLGEIMINYRIEMYRNVICPCFRRMFLSFSALL